MKIDPTSIPFPLSTQVTRSSYGFAERAGAPRWVFGYEECSPEYAVDRQDGFPFWIVEIVLHGRGETIFGSRAVETRRGSFWKYGPGTPISFRASPRSPLKKVFIALLPHERESKLFHQIERGIHDSATSIDLIDGLFRELSLANHHATELSGAAADSLINAIIALLYRAADLPLGDSAQEALTRRALRLLESEFAQLKSVQDWAAALKVSPNHLSRSLKASTGKAPYYTLLDHKINRAFHLLSVGAGPIKDVAALVGFDDPFHFSRLFKKRLGFPPSFVSR